MDLLPLQRKTNSVLSAQEHLEHIDTIAPSRFRDYVALAKPRLASLVVISSVLGYILATGTTGLEWSALLALISGGFLVTGGGNGLNQVIERKTDKLMKLTLDVGDHERTVVSGIAQHFKAEEIIGQQVSLLANLAPRKMRGVESQGMVLMAEDKDGKLRFIEPKEGASAGSKIS